ncbi:MAG TPA: hypothetical protein VGR65_11115 [Casimicrobiaceae bacterium]|jgi:hypothetical protein|nr:hypothetical protein [Casimicrobiaceae bacterium]
MASKAFSKSRIRLQVLCETLPTVRSPWIPDVYLSEYADILGTLREDGVDVAGFEIPPNVVESERGCEREFFVMKLTGLLLHLSAIAPEVVGPDIAVLQRIRMRLQPPEDEDVPF